jgi:hypothetical protein
MATAQKSDAMRMYGRWIAEVVAHKPKHAKQRIKYDIKNFITAGTAIIIIAVAALSTMRP